MSKRRAEPIVLIKEIAYFPNHTHYTVSVDIEGEPTIGLVIRSYDDSLKVDGKGIHPAITRLMISRVRDHIREVRLS
jgi:hypothetical protein